MSNQDTYVPFLQGIVAGASALPHNVNLANGVPLERLGAFGSQEFPTALPPRPISLSQT